MSEVAVGYVSLVPKFGSGFKSAIAGQIGQAGTAGGTTAGNSFKSTFLGVLAGNVMTSAIRGIGSTIKGAFGGGFDRLMNIEQAEIKLRTLGINVTPPWHRSVTPSTGRSSRSRTRPTWRPSSAHRASPPART